MTWREAVLSWHGNVAWMKMGRWRAHLNSHIDLLIHPLKLTLICPNPHQSYVSTATFRQLTGMSTSQVEWHSLMQVLQCVDLCSYHDLVFIPQSRSAKSRFVYAAPITRTTMRLTGWLATTPPSTSIAIRNENVYLPTTPIAPNCHRSRHYGMFVGADGTTDLFSTYNDVTAPCA